MEDKISSKINKAIKEMWLETMKEMYTTRDESESTTRGEFTTEINSFTLSKPIDTDNTDNNTDNTDNTDNIDTNNNTNSCREGGNVVDFQAYKNRKKKEVNTVNLWILNHAELGEMSVSYYNEDEDE